MRGGLRKQGEGVVLNYAKLNSRHLCTRTREAPTSVASHTLGGVARFWHYIFAILFGALLLDRPTRETAPSLRVFTVRSRVVSKVVSGSYFCSSEGRPLILSLGKSSRGRMAYCVGRMQYPFPCIFESYPSYANVLAAVWYENPECSTTSMVNENCHFKELLYCQ